MQSTLQRKTTTDFARLPEGTLAQLIDGEIIMSPSPVPKHQLVIMRLAARLQIFCEKNDAGLVLTAPQDVFFNEHEAYQPDILFISKKNKHIIHEDCIRGTPNLVVEVLSPSTAYYDLRHKKRVYEAYGVQEYWIVDTHEERVEIHSLQEGKYVLAAEANHSGEVISRHLPNFKVSLPYIFREI